MACAAVTAGPRAGAEPDRAAHHSVPRRHRDNDPQTLTIRRTSGYRLALHRDSQQGSSPAWVRNKECRRVRQTDRKVQIDKQGDTDRQAGKQKDGQTERQTDKDGVTDEQMNRQTFRNRQTCRDTDRQTDRSAGGQTDR